MTTRADELRNKMVNLRLNDAVVAFDKMENCMTTSERREENKIIGGLTNVFGCKCTQEDCVPNRCNNYFQCEQLSSFILARERSLLLSINPVLDNIAKHSYMKTEQEEQVIRLLRIIDERLRNDK